MSTEDWTDSGKPKPYPAAPDLPTENLRVALIQTVRAMDTLPPFSQQRAGLRRDAETLRAMIREWEQAAA
jgi:hypothetical protein